ncbi:hypothetical protein VZT92_009289 [Zoarces viviparus]|uniref:Secreted protein n=1 Tax=Zoarces viviparus TaxID=48416 RepID=A0AAW1FHE8_ZOAVI
MWWCVKDARWTNDAFALFELFFVVFCAAEHHVNGNVCFLENTRVLLHEEDEASCAIVRPQCAFQRETKGGVYFKRC